MHYCSVYKQCLISHVNLANYYLSFKTQLEKLLFLEAFSDPSHLISCSLWVALLLLLLLSSFSRVRLCVTP